MEKILYLTSKSIYICAAQRTLLEIISKQIEKGYSVAVLLIQDSTLACWKDGKNVISEAGEKGIEVYAIKEDLDARGIVGDKIHPSIKPVNYDEAMQLIMEKYDKVITWC